MIRKEIRTDAGYSVAEFNGVRRVFATIAASRGVTLLEQAESALQTIQVLFREEAGSGSIVMLSVFLKNIEDQAACRRIVEEFYGNCRPPAIFPNRPATENCCRSRLGPLPAAATTCKSSIAVEEW